MWSVEKIGCGGAANLSRWVGFQGGFCGHIVKFQVVRKWSLPESPLVGFVPDLPVANAHAALDIYVLHRGRHKAAHSS